MSGRQRTDFCSDERGVVLAEALLVFPIMTILSFGLLEFGNVLWEREQLQVGLRDAARYWSRCRTDIGGIATSCSEATARNIAFYGNPSGTGPLRVPGWDDPSEINFEPGKASLPSNSSLPADPADMAKVVVTGRVTYEGSPAFAMLLDDAVTIGHRVEMRFIGW